MMRTAGIWPTLGSVWALANLTMRVGSWRLVENQDKATVAERNYHRIVSYQNWLQAFSEE